MSCCRGLRDSQRLLDTVTPSAKAVGPTGLESWSPLHPRLVSAGSPKVSVICQEAVSRELLEENNKEATKSQGTGLGSSLLESALPGSHLPLPPGCPPEERDPLDSSAALPSPPRRKESGPPPPPHGKGEQTPSLPGTSGPPGMTPSEGGGWSDRGAWARKTPRDAPTPATP